MSVECRQKAVNDIHSLVACELFYVGLPVRDILELDTDNGLAYLDLVSKKESWSKG